MIDNTPMRTLLISKNRFEEKICLLEDNEPSEVYIWTRDNKPRAGEIYLGKVANIVPGLQAVFVNIGREKNGYLFFHEKEKCKRFKPGDSIFVQVQKEETQEKGVKLTEDFFLTGKYLVYFPQNSFRKVSKKIEGEERDRLFSFLETLPFLKGGIIVRTAAHGLEEEVLFQEARQLQAKWNKIQRVLEKMKNPGLVYRHKTNIFSWLSDAASLSFTSIQTDDEEIFQGLEEYFEFFPSSHKPHLYYHSRGDLFEKKEINKALEKALKNKVWLSSGGYILISEKPFLTTLDVNSGRFAGTAQSGLAETARHINREAAVQIARQIRFRNLGGLIVIDFIDLKKKEEIETICSILEDELKKSLIFSDIIGVNDVGLLTIVRKRKYTSLKQLYMKPCSCCNGSGNSANVLFHVLKTRQAILLQYEDRNVFDFILHIPTIFKNIFLELVTELENDYNISVELFVSDSIQENSFDVSEHLEITPETF